MAALIQHNHMFSQFPGTKPAPFIKKETGSDKSNNNNSNSSEFNNNSNSSEFNNNMCSRKFITSGVISVQNNVTKSWIAASTLLT